MADYYTLLTNAGIAYENACKVAGLPIKLSQISVGDGNGAVYNPGANATALKREVWRGPLNALFQDEKNPSWLLAEVTIPPEVGGWYVREAGLWTDTGILYAIVKYPESFKPVLATSGSGKEFYIRAIFETSNASSVTLLIDDTIVKATRAWVMGYVADELSRLDDKQSVRVATTANIELRGAQQIDGVAVVEGDRVGVVRQSAQKDNGVYVVANGSWARAVDANSSQKVTPGLSFFVEEGELNSGSAWRLVTRAPIALGTTALVFEMAVGRTGVEPGTYRSLTVDKYGRVKAGTNPTTLSGYGITDAFTKPETTSAIQQAVSGLVNSSPAALDTLSELAAALGNDPNFATSVTNTLAGKAGKATTLGGYGITDAYTKYEINSSLAQFIKSGQSLPAYSNLTFSSNDSAKISNIAGVTGSLMVDNGGNTDASAVIAFHRVGAFAAYIGVDTDNQWKVGGWSMGNVGHVLWHAGNFNPASKINSDRCINAGFAGGGDITTDPYMQHLNGSVAWLATKAYSVLGFQIVKGDTGYIKLPDFLGGFILQWTRTPTLSTNTTYTWNFPLGFPAKCAGVIGTQIGTSQGPIEVSVAPSQAGVGLAIGIQTASVGPAFVWAWGW
jgi:phage-related tail fiber protein